MKSKLEEQIAGIHHYAAHSDFRYLRAVVVIGEVAEAKPWEILRKYSLQVGNPLVVFVFIPKQGEAIKLRPHLPEKTFVTDELIELRTLIGTHIDANWQIDIMGDPATHEKWQMAVNQAVADGRRFKISGEITARTNAVGWADIGLDHLPKLVDRKLLNGFNPSLRGIPAVIVGAGPSLDRNIKELARIQDKVAIFATNSSVGVLEKHGVQPDFIHVVEAKPTAVEPILDSPLWEKAILVSGIHSHPGAWGVKAVANLPALTPVGAVGMWLIRDWKIQPMYTGGSVSTLCYSAARQLGCGPIILVGMDCANGNTGRNDYAHGVKHTEKKEPGPVDQYDTLTQWGGIGQVRAFPALSCYREWFEHKALGHRKQTGLDPLINATEGGAQIAYTEELKLSKVAERFTEKVDPVGLVMMDIGSTTSPRSGGEYWDDGHGRIIDRATLIAKLKNQLHVMETDTIDRAKLGLDCVSSLYHQVPALITSMSQAHLLANYTLNPLEEQLNLPNKTNIEAMRSAFARIVEKSDILLDKISQCIERLEEQ